MQRLHLRRQPCNRALQLTPRGCCRRQRGLRCRRCCRTVCLRGVQAVTCSLRGAVCRSPRRSGCLCRPRRARLCDRRSHAGQLLTRCGTRAACGGGCDRVQRDGSAGTACQRAVRRRRQCGICRGTQRRQVTAQRHGLRQQRHRRCRRQLHRHRALRRRQPALCRRNACTSCRIPRRQPPHKRLLGQRHLQRPHVCRQARHRRRGRRRLLAPHHQRRLHLAILGVQEGVCHGAQHLHRRRVFIIRRHSCCHFYPAVVCVSVGGGRNVVGAVAGPACHTIEIPPIHITHRN